MKKLKIRDGIATNSILLTMVQVVTTLFGLVVTKLLSVHFSLSEYGTYSQALLITSTATSISILGLTNATNYFYNRTDNEECKKKYISTIFFIQYVVGSLCTIFIILFSTEITKYFDNSSLKNLLYIVAFTPLMTNLISMYQTLYVSIGKAKLIAVRNLVISIIRLIAVILSCYIFDEISIVLIAILFMDIGQILYFSYGFSIQKYKISLKNIDFSIIKEILYFSIPMAIYVLTNSLSRDLDKYVVSAFSDTSTLAIYSNASRILPFDMLTASLITVLIPTMTRLINQKDFKKAQNIFKLYLRMGFLLTFIFVGGALSVAKYLMLFLYDEKYLAGLPIFIIYLIIDMIRFANVTTILSGSGKSKLLMKISVVTLILNLIFNVVGFKLLGIVGPAIVTLLLTIVMTLALLHFGAKEIQIKIVKLFDFKEIFIVLFEILFFGSITKLFSNILYENNFSTLMILIFSYGAFILVMFILNFKRIISVFRELNRYK